MLEFACPPSTGRVGEFEGPQEVGSLQRFFNQSSCMLDLVPYLFEVRANGENFVDKVLNAKNVVFSECLLDHLVVGQRHPLFINPSVSALVDQFTDSLKVRLAGNGSASGYTQAYKKRPTHR